MPDQVVGDVTVVHLTQKYEGAEAACKGGGTGAGRQMSFALLSAVSDACHVYLTLPHKSM